MEEKNRNVKAQIDPTTIENNTRSIVHNGVATFTIDEVEVDIKVKPGQVGCFTGTDYTIDTTGIIKDKSSRPGVPVWGCRIAGIDYTFDNDGHCTMDEVNLEYPEEEPHHLWIVASSIDVAEGSIVTGTTRGEMVGTKIVNVDSLTTRDTFAIAALEALIHRMDDPIECSTASVRFITDKAYEYANSMMISSAYARVSAGEDEPSGDSPGTIDVDPTTLSNNTEKLLNNIHKAIEASTSTLNNIKTQEAAKFTSGIKVDNPENESHVVDKFQIEGAGGGGGGISYTDIPMLAETGQTTMSHVLGFGTDSENNKYVGKLAFMTFVNKIWTAILNAVKLLIDERGSINIGTDGAWNSDIVDIIDDRITTKVKSEALNP
jgi:hypothetical protein